MNELEFKELLLHEIRRFTNNTLPWPPETSHDRVQYLAYIGRLICPEYVFKWPQMDWFDCDAIRKFYGQFPQERRVYNMDRRWNVIQFLRLIASVPGATAECGVFEGATSMLILEHSPKYDNQERPHYIFDSFEGLSQPGAYDNCGHFKKGDLRCGEEEVRTKLASFGDRVHFHKGWIPVCFEFIADTVFAFVHIDVDLYQPTKDSIEFFYPRLSTGAVLICDDYGMNTCPGATRAINGFLADKKEKMLAFASGGGFFIKGLETASD